MKISGKVALGGIFGALSILCMLLTAFPFGLYALPALAGALLLPIALETGVRWGLVSYAAVALLALLVSPSMEAKALFIAFFGYYPTLKIAVERRLSVPLQWVTKLLLFNATMVGCYWLLLHVLGLEADTFELFGVQLPLVFLAAGNVIFVIFDLALTGVVQLYWRQWHPRFRRMFK